MTKDEMIMKVFFTYAWQKRTTKCECGCGNKLPKEINIVMAKYIGKYNTCSDECSYFQIFQKEY